MKKLCLMIAIVLGMCEFIHGQKQCATLYLLNATGYDAHVELNWNNQAGFKYEIYCSVENGKEFVKRGETNLSYFFDFTGSLGSNLNLLYRIVPEGLNVYDPRAIKFQTQTSTHSFSDDELIDMVQKYTTRYFYEFAHPDCGMARERSNDLNGDIVTTGGTGFGIMALIAGAEQKYLSRENAYNQIKKMVEFLNRVDRFHGAWAHWYNGNTGKPFRFSQYDDGGDLVETAFLMQGLLTARQYFINGNENERLLSNQITKLWEDVEWDWYTRETDSLYWHWSKNYGWKMNHRIKGFDETLITYVLAASSPTHAIDAKVYHACYPKSDYFFNGNEYYGIKLSLGMPYGGPLFFAHYSFLGLNPNGLKDRYANYFERNLAHVQIHKAYAIDNPKKWIGYGANCWGFTSSDDPLVGYSSHQPGTANDNGTVSPTAALSSIVYTPKASIDAMRYFYYQLGSEIFGPYGFYDAFNLNMVSGQQVVHSYLAIDQGPIAVMLENHRSGLIWKLFMQNSEINSGLEKLGFDKLNLSFYESNK